jgi:hypothetical protein
MSRPVTVQVVKGMHGLPPRPKAKMIYDLQNENV